LYAVLLPQEHRSQALTAFQQRLSAHQQIPLLKADVAAIGSETQAALSAALTIALLSCRLAAAEDAAAQMAACTQSQTALQPGGATATRNAADDAAPAEAAELADSTKDNKHAAEYKLAAAAAAEVAVQAKQVVAAEMWLNARDRLADTQEKLAAAEGRLAVMGASLATAEDRLAAAATAERAAPDRLAAAVAAAEAVAQDRLAAAVAAAEAAAQDRLAAAAATEAAVQDRLAAAEDKLVMAEYRLAAAARLAEAQDAALSAFAHATDQLELWRQPADVAERGCKVSIAFSINSNKDFSVLRFLRR
jgi:hypothetical protein